ncbi:MAG: GC-type dockerin domain-anchored protein [Planctomycetota bacterium]
MMTPKMHDASPFAITLACAIVATHAHAQLHHETDRNAGVVPHRIALPADDAIDVDARFGLRSSVWAGAVCQITDPALCVEANLASSGGFFFNASSFPIAQPLRFGTGETSDPVTIEGFCVEGVYSGAIGDGLSIADNFQVSYVPADIHGAPNLRAPIATFSQADGSLVVEESENQRFFGGVSSVFSISHAPVDSPANTWGVFLVLLNDSEIPWFIATGAISGQVCRALQATGACPDDFVSTNFDTGAWLGLAIDSPTPDAELGTKFFNQCGNIFPALYVPPSPDLGDNTGCFEYGQAGPADGSVNLSDFACYLNFWSASDPYADVTGSAACDFGQRDCVIDLSDFACYLATWADAQPR